MINFTIVKTEFNRLLKLNLIWAVIWGLLSLMMFSFFDLMNDVEGGVENIFEAFPDEFLDLFGAEVSFLSTIEGYFSLEMFLMYGLGAAIFGSFLGGNSIGKEISSRTFHFLLAKPISRVSIYVSKFTALAVLAVISNILIAVFSYLAAELLVTSDTAEFEYFALIFTLGGILQILFTAFGQFVSVVTDEGKALLSAAAISIVGIVVDSVANLNGAPEFLKFLTPYYYTNTSHLVETGEIATPDVWVLVLAIPVFFIAGIWYFRRKDINI